MADREITRILELWRDVSAKGGEAVLATVIRTEGSSYRLPGARLLLTRDGRRAGSVSGGCLEEDLLRKAWWFTEPGPGVRRYDTNADGEIVGQYGLGCNGIIYVALERVRAGHSAALDLLARVRETRVPATLAHPPSAPGHDSFVETITPVTRLLVFGAGDDAVPLTDFAAQLGWEVHVFDGRAHYARKEKFPHAASVSVRSAGSGEPIAADAWTVAAVMSHSYKQDLANLRELLPLKLPYLGVLGPRKRTEQLLAEIGTRGPVHAPMGLDLGADGPEQVALAAIAEMQAVLNGRAGGQLRYREGSIHQCA